MVVRAVRDPCGGITVENCSVLVKAGADFLSVISGEWDYPNGPQAAVRDFNAAIEAARR
jgi:thiamine-phosphate pyrophosphorylase